LKSLPSSPIYGKTPTNCTEAPFARLMDPTYDSPDVGAAALVIVHVTVVVLPAVSVVPPQAFPALVTPPNTIVDPVGVVLAVPLLMSEIVHTESATVVQVTTAALTLAVLVNEPKRPKTKPATAMAAISVIAMRITVARTGEIAFLLRVGILKLCVTLLYGNIPLNAADPPLESESDPTYDSPDVPATQVPSPVIGIAIGPAPAVMVTGKAVLAGTQVTPP